MPSQEIDRNTKTEPTEPEVEAISQADDSDELVEDAKPLKRARTEEAQSPSQTYSRDELTYFDDGNIVVVAGHMAFKVHRGQLSRHSEILCQKLKSLPENNHLVQYDGCPVLQLPDRVEAVRHLLKALYDGFHDFRAEETTHMNGKIGLGYLWNVTELSTKYRIRTLRQQALEMLTTFSPDKLEKYIHMSVHGVPKPQPFYTLVLAYETGSRRLLPAAYCNACCMHLNEALKHIRLGGLKSEYWENWMKGKTALADWLTLFLKDKLSTYLHQSCPKKLICETNILEIKKFYLDAALQPSHVAGSFLTPQPFHILTRIKDQHSKSLCPLCQQALTEGASSAMQELWSQLPGFFGLEPWDELRN